MEGFILKEVSNADEAYRQLAVAVVAQACEDYLQHCITPNYEKYAEIGKNVLNECKIAASFVFHAYEFYTGEGKGEDPPMEFLKQVMCDFIDYAMKRHREIPFFQPNEHDRWLAEERKKIAKCGSLSELNDLTKKLKSKVTYWSSYLQRRNFLWIREGKQLEKYFDSPEYTLYTNGKADGESVKNELRRQAAAIKRKEGHSE